MNDIKVIKQFGLLKKGDILSYDKTNNSFYFENTTNNNGIEKYRSVMLDVNTVKSLIQNGYVIELKESNNSKVNTTAENTIADTIVFINNLLNQYKTDLKNVEEKASNGEIPQCVKVEAQTVYFNMNKVLTEVLKKLNYIQDK